MKNILISTGGSGGHVVPATIIYEHLKDEFNVCMTSDQRGIKFLDRDKYNIKIINLPKVSKNIFLVPFQMILLLGLTIRSFFFLKKKKIEILISTGGYMSFPMCLASKLLKIKLLLYEPNMVLGRSNKFFIKNCSKIFCYSDKIKNFPNKLRGKITLIPALLRKNFYEINGNEKKIQNAELSKKEINLLIIGGSQGAKLFDTVIKNSIVDLSKKYKLNIFQQTKANNFHDLKNFYLSKKIQNQLFDFNDDIYNYMKKTDICITRAGASTLAELIFLNIAHIAIPLPSAKDNHQFENASFYRHLDCNWIVDQHENEINLTSKLLNIIENKDEFLNKKNNMKSFSCQNTWNNINQKLINTINEY
ncbi:UDP-N-acetylglucosamine--N-acetylmuramyl-(pentapeptide) pyrophosphoryl-undecaprenol N-acetylglucosamine transferase [Candidatus Pelagibacter sp.]|nr:UDP-N-acetylglucosamine--N-acetylmuramyl-(pentapeptide) pyrophosphoryl-undecaprenol N-acetylglucosamine transferase [Candidatus Pelagibacter sp.]